ncbi:hypothetical protein EDD37DRAFT_632253 [Exophiala viscosa]|uniref:uncharacterized protein n=1 Tax=Exophiala viscosa TaxID=2486360 RepID=UPI0021999539|nr:hypothetical protein EDD37DRAFT_632253 [Exophiala viscosa]
MTRRSVDGRVVTIINGMGSWEDATLAGAALYGAYGTDGNILESPKIVINKTNPSYDFGPFDNGLKSFYVTNSGTNPICVAGVIVNTPDGEMALSGNLAKVCHIDNYESKDSVATPDSACVWVDRHGSNGIKVPGLMFDLTVMDEERIEASTPITNVQDLCMAPFMMAATLPVKRDSESIATDCADCTDFRTQLIKSGRKGNSAARLCADKSAIGPDFVSLEEKLYCDMETRHMYPLCDDKLAFDGRCFDTDHDELVESNDKVSGGKRDVQEEEKNVVKTFEKVEIWY